MNALSDYLIGKTTPPHLQFSVDRQFSDLIKCGVPIFIPSIEDKECHVSRDTLPTYLAYFDGSPSNLKIDIRFLVILQSLFSITTHFDQPTSYTPQLVKGLLQRLGKVFTLPKGMKISLPQLWSVTHGPRRDLRKGNSGLCTAPGHLKNTTSLDPNLESIGLDVCSQCSGLLTSKSLTEIKTLFCDHEMPVWIPTFIRKLLVPDIFMAFFGSAILRKELKEESLQGLIDFTKEWVIRIPETCYADPSMIGYLWKLNLVSSYTRTECIFLGHLHWNIQQADKSIGFELGTVGCTKSMKPKALYCQAKRQYHFLTQRLQRKMQRVCTFQVLSF